MTSPSRVFYDVRPFRGAGLFALTFSAIVFFGSRPASANYTTSYAGNGCQPSSTSWSGFSFTSNGGIQGNYDGGGWVVCPIAKYTSGPSIYTDAISNISITIANNGGSPGIYCQAIVYSSQVPQFDDDTNVEYFDKHQSNTSDTNITWAGLGGSNWWQTYSWFYAQLECNLQPYEELVSYEVTEEGSSSGNYVIYPYSAYCLSENSLHMEQEQMDLSDLSPGGFAEDLASGSDGRDFFQCETPLDYIQYSMQPTASTQTGWEWSFSSSGSPPSSPSWNCTMSGGNVTGPTGYAFQGVPGNETESFYFPNSSLPSGAPFQAAAGTWATEDYTEWLSTSLYNWVYFQQCGNEGDFGMVSYRAANF